MQTNLSIIMPGIRNERWQAVYESIEKSCKQSSWELIVVGPKPPDFSRPNMKFVQDFGSPMRASQIGATLAEGKIITWTADDGLFIEDEIDNCLRLLSPFYYSVVAAKYTEGDGIIHPDSYYKLIKAYPETPAVNPNWWIFNVAFMKTEFFELLGGWDCRYEACPCGHADLAFRAQFAGAKVTMYPKSILTCTHMPDITGDHAPVHYAQTEHDEQLYRQLNSTVDNRAIFINNWKQAPSIWTRRFSKENICYE